MPACPAAGVAGRFFIVRSCSRSRCWPRRGSCARRPFFFGDRGLGERYLGKLDVGPWRVSLAEYLTTEPVDQGLAGHMKTFALALNPASVDAVKANYLRVGKPRSLRAAGLVFSGTPYRQLTAAPIPTAPNRMTNCG